jgi:hemolysin D
VRIEARDVGFIRPGDPVKVKFDAFNFIEHGMAEGKLRWVSEGAFTTNDDGLQPTVQQTGQPTEPYYKGRVELDNVELRNVPDGFRLIPGMTLTGDVHIGTRSLLMYVVTGALQGMGEAMREP